MRKYVMIAKLAMFAYVKYDFMTKMVRNLDMLRNFEHVMKVVSYDKFGDEFL